MPPTSLARVGADVPVDDLGALVSAAWQLGRGKESVRIAERVFAQLACTGSRFGGQKAARTRLGMAHPRRPWNICQGWMNRARRLLDGAPEGPTHGYLAYLDASVAVFTEDSEALAVRVKSLRELCAHRRARRDSARSGGRGGGGDLRGEGRRRLWPDGRGTAAGGGRSGSPGMGRRHLLHRAALLSSARRTCRACEPGRSRWSAGVAISPPPWVCDVHRLQVQAATDDYHVLEDRLFAASRALEEVNPWAAGEEPDERLGEVRRMRGDADGAFAAYIRARALGVEPQPGEALLRCRHGDSQTARTDLRRAGGGGCGWAGCGCCAGRPRWRWPATASG